MAMRARPALPFYGLQYRLCEVGPHRLDPRELRDGLTKLSGTPTGVVEYCKGIYSDPGAVREATTKTAQSVQDVLDKLSRLDSTAVFSRFVKLISDHVDGRLLYRSPHSRPRTLTPVSQVSARDTVLEIKRPNARPVRLWVSFDPEWIYPYDDRLWAFLRDCAQEDIHPTVFARKIAPSTFPLFKALDVFGIQYYAWLSPDRCNETLLRAVDTTGLPLLQRLSPLIGGRAIDLIERAVAGRPHHGISDLSRHAILAAESYGLMQQTTATLDALITWSAITESPLPDAWRSGIAKSALPDHMDRTVRAPLRRHTRADSTPATTNIGDEKILGFGRKTKVTRVPMRV